MPGQIKVAYYLNRFPNLTETFILREMLSLREMGVDVQVFAMMPPVKSATMHQQVQEMMPFVHFSPFLLSFKLILAQFHFLFRCPAKYIRAFWRAVWQTAPEPATLARTLLLFPKSVYFARQIQQMQADHIHAHFVWVNGIAAQIASDLTGISFSLHAHAFDIFMRNQESVRRQLKLATAIVTISEYHRQYLANLCERWHPQDIQIVHCGLNPSEFIPGLLSTGNQKVQIISVGRLEEKKGHKYLIEACALLAKKGYKFSCSIVGRGPIEADLQTRINEHELKDYVFLTGPLNQADLKILYRQSDIFTLACVVAKSGDRDGLPVVLMEAMALELPVITTPVTGIPELVQDGENGLLVPERDAESLAIAIERLIKNPDLRTSLGKAGRQTILSGFDIHRTAPQMARIFGDIITRIDKDSSTDKHMAIHPTS